MLLAPRTFFGSLLLPALLGTLQAVRRVETVVLTRSGGFLVAVPGFGERASEAAYFGAELRDGAGRSHGAFVRPTAIDREGRVVWWAVHGDAGAGRYELRLGPDLGRREPGAPSLSTRETSGRVEVAGLGFAAVFGEAGKAASFRWSEGCRWEGALRLRVASIEETFEWRARLESATPFRAAVVLEATSGPSAKVRFVIGRDGEMEFTALAAPDPARASRTEAMGFQWTTSEAWTSAQLGGDGRRWKLEDSLELRARGGPTLTALLRAPQAAERERWAEVPARPSGIALRSAQAVSIVQIDRMELREPSAFRWDGGVGKPSSIQILWLSEPRALVPGEQVGGAARISRLPAASDSSAIGKELERLEIGSVALLGEATYRRCNVLGFVDAPLRLPRPLLDDPLDRIWPQWRDGSRGAYGDGFREDGDPPLAPEVPSNLEFDAIRAALTMAVLRRPGALSAARAGAHHWRSFDFNREARLPWLHAPHHKKLAVDPGHCWIEGLLDLAMVTDDASALADAEKICDELGSRAQDPDRELERTLAWPLLSLCAFERIRPRRATRDAMQQYANALLHSEDASLGLAKVESRSGKERWSWSPWLGGGLVGEALDEYGRLTGDERVGPALKSIEQALARCFDAARGCFAKKLQFYEDAEEVRSVPEGTLRGGRSWLILSLLSRLERRGANPERSHWASRVLRSEEARIHRVPRGSFQWWTLAFRCRAALGSAP
ncbi:MAG: hypothetical protein JNJ88_13340 [Planctomycetes bacterium]|nr:hypothetical protein [Planctomycetota bacterium]